jgi:hypothetical protein
MKHELRRRGMHAGYWWGKPDGKRPLERPRRKWVDNIKMKLVWIGLIGLRIGTNGGLL